VTLVGSPKSSEPLAERDWQSLGHSRLPVKAVTKSIKGTVPSTFWTNLTDFLSFKANNRV